jgi:hypothetical protein
MFGFHLATHDTQDRLKPSPDKPEQSVVRVRFNLSKRHNLIELPRVDLVEHPIDVDSTATQRFSDR